MIRRAATIAILIAAVWVTFAPAVGFSFLNWDDNLVIVDNAALTQPGVMRWAFTTTYMEHYQPVSWLVWAALRGEPAPDPARYHTANIVLHAVVTLLVFAVACRLFAFGQGGQSPSPAGAGGLSPSRAADIVAGGAALLYAVPAEALV